MRLLDWSAIKAAGFDELVVAKFGDADTGLVTCLEFYRVSQRPGGTFLAVEEPPRSSQGVARTKAVESVPESRVFILLEHDYKPGVVTSVKPEDAKGEILFRITREMKGRTGKREGLRYTLVCEKNYIVRSDLEFGTWDIPEKRD